MKTQTHILCSTIDEVDSASSSVALMVCEDIETAPKGLSLAGTLTTEVLESGSTLAPPEALRILTVNFCSEKK